jgi:hypothetical protein
MPTPTCATCGHGAEQHSDGATGRGCVAGPDGAKCSCRAYRTAAESKLVEALADLLPAGDYVPHGGDDETLRDRFAAHVLGAAFAEADGEAGLDEIARRAYAMADAMLVARKGGA